MCSHRTLFAQLVLTLLFTAVKRIKEGLIHKAKLKKEYSKALREEALESGQAAPRRSPAKQKQAEDDNEDETSAEEGDEEDREERSPAAEASQTQEQQKKKRHRGGKSYRRPAPPPEAAASSSRPGKPRRLSPEELEKVRVQKSKDKQVWGRRTQRGQPQLGKRVEVRTRSRVVPSTELCV